ncbi:MAG: TonB-dependent receptor [Bacteroidetes bacterium]|nr:TonB-dependent receptor [Bacteroidota bacterium]
MFFFSHTNFCFSQTNSETGSVSGTISDKVTGELLGGAVVFIDSTSVGKKGTSSDFDGNYKITGMPIGIYKIRFSAQSYKTQLITGVEIKSGQKNIVLNVVMEPSTVMDSEVVIKEIRISNTESSVAAEMKNEDKAVSVIGGAQISKSQDRDASEVVKRIPGVTIIDNRFIMVRGLSERYNSVWLNDAGAPSMETDKRAFSFEMIPSGMVDRILIYKTPSPELPADFAGGMVKIYTKAFPEKNYLSVNYQNSFRAGTTGKTFYYNLGSSMDKFGIDNGYRNMPDGSPDYFNRSSATNTQQTLAFHNDWGILSKGAIPDQRFSLMYAAPIHLKNGILFGNTFGVSYSNVFTTYQIHRQDWDSLTQTEDYADIQSTQTVRTNAIENFSMLFGNNKLEFKNLINSQGRSWVTQRVSNYLDGPSEKSYAEGYENRLIYSSQLVGDHKSKNGKTEYNWTAGFGYTERNAPDLRRITYAKARTAGDSMYSAQVAPIVDPIHGGGRFFAWQNERVYSFNQNFRHTFYIGGDSAKNRFHFDVNIGTYAEYKSRQFIARVIGYTINPSQTAYYLKFLPIDQIFSPENIGGTGFKMDEITSASDKYTAQNLQVAEYTSLSLPIGKKIKIVGGTRYEFNQQALQSFVNQDSINPKITTKFLLPSVNATYNFNEKTLIRLAYGKSLNRPEFREWSPFYFYDFDFLAGTYGSLYPTVLAPQGQVLKVAQVDNYDARFEFYPGLADYIQFGVFYKSLKDPIQQVILNSGGSDSRAFSFINADYAFTEGIEFDMRKNLAVFDTIFQTQTFGNFNVVANFSLIKSRLYISGIQNQAASNPLQGQSPYVVNGGIYYQNDSIGFQASLLYNVFGPRLFLVGALNYANIGELPRQSLDISVSQKIWKCFSLTFGIQNILDQHVRMVQDTNRNGKFEKNGMDEEIMGYKLGRYFTAGIKVNLTGK